MWKYALNWCWHQFDTKTNIKQKKIIGFTVNICPKCWYYNSMILEKWK